MNFKVFKVASGGRGRHTNFEHVELGRGSTNFKVFKVASAGQCRHTNFENFEVGGGTASFKVFNVKTRARDTDKGPNEPNDLAYYPSWAAQKPGGRNYALASLTY
jgi:hypothetical protein